MSSLKPFFFSIFMGNFRTYVVILTVENSRGSLMVKLTDRRVMSSSLFPLKTRRTKEADPYLIRRGSNILPLEWWKLGERMDNWGVV
ncbi:hypothetical protein TNCV_2772711 [Trichonephila clavipes]|nr:hypothetical protein TNCV_2772711 [Trichonephila clavipes]